MRLLLDAHISPRRVAEPLRRRGHDVRAAIEERALERASDESLLRLAAAEGRIMVTFDVNDFPGLLREWAAAERTHAGCVLVAGLRPDAYGPLLRGLDFLFKELPTQDAWVNQSRYLPK